jgi:hypothetical protein
VNNASSTETISTGGQNRAAFVLQGSETNGPDSPATTVNGAKFAGATLISDSISPPQSPSSAAAISPFDSGNGVVLSSIHLHSNLFALGNSGDQGNSPPADGEIATAAADVKLIGDVIFVDLSSARQLLKSGMGPASIAVSADFMKTLLLSDATALAQVANAAAARVDVEIKMLRKEFGIFAGLGLVIGIYTLKGRKDLDASVPAKKRRKFLAVGDADSTVFPG